MSTDWMTLAIIAILTGPSYGIAALLALLWFVRRQNRPEVHVHYDRRTDDIPKADQ